MLQMAISELLVSHVTKSYNYDMIYLNPHHISPDIEIALTVKKKKRPNLTCVNIWNLLDLIWPRSVMSLSRCFGSLANGDICVSLACG